MNWLPTDPNVSDDYDSPAYTRQPDIKGANTRAFVYCHALMLCDAQQVFNEWLQCQDAEAREEQDNE